MTEPARFGLVEDVDDVTAPVRSTALEALRAELTAETDDDLILLSVPSRKGYAVRFSAKVPYEQYARWTKRAEDRSMPGGVNLLRLAGIVLANTCRGIVRNGEDVVLDGEPVTFTSKALQEMLGSSDAVGTVAVFYGNDGHVISSGTEVINAAGYGESIEQDTPDPTSR